MSQAHIQIELFASLRPFTPKNADHFAIDEGQTVQDVLNGLDVPLDEIQLVFVDGAKANLSRPLKGGERVGIFPPIGGG